MEARKKIQITLLLSILFFILIKLFFPIADNGKLIADSFWITKTHTPEKFNIVVCGDSRVYRSFSITAMQERIEQPLTGINLGYSSTGFSDEYLDFVISKLDSNSKIQILVLGITPHSLTSEAFKNDHLKSFQKLKAIEIYKGLYLSEFLTHFIAYQPTDLFKKNKISNENVEFSSDGWAATSWIKTDTNEAIASYKRSFSAYRVSDKEVSSFFKKVEKIKLKGVTIIAYRPPSTVQMRILEDSISGYNEYLIKEQLIKRDVIWMDFKDEDFNSYDGSHLDSKSAEKFSRIIGEKINELHLNNKK